LHDLKCEIIRALRVKSRHRVKRWIQQCTGADFLNPVWIRINFFKIIGTGKVEKYKSQSCYGEFLKNLHDIFLNVG
jgi:hypothetical protein